jgi:hypothetical protein
MLPASLAPGADYTSSVRMVIELHGGDFAVESREGEGSRFTVWLPLRSPWRPVRDDASRGLDVPTRSH